MLSSSRSENRHTCQGGKLDLLPAHWAPFRDGWDRTPRRNGATERRGEERKGEERRGEERTGQDRTGQDRRADSRSTPSK